MKKLYIAPEAEIVKIETQGMMALSAGFTDTTITNPENIGARELNITEEPFEVQEENFEMYEEDEF